MNARISVIIPTYNRVHLLTRALDSVLSQTLSPMEIIVVDDGSSDQSRTLIENNYRDVRLLVQEHKGVSAARNTGIRQAGGEWLALLDSDDAWLPDKLEQQFDRLVANKDHLVIHSNETWIRNGKVIKQMGKHRRYGGYIFQRCLPLCVMSPSSIMIHQDVFHDVGLFNEELPVCEDYDMWLRICHRYPVLLHEQALTLKYGGHADQLSRQYWGMDRFRIRILANILAEEDLDEDERQAAIDMLLAKIEIFIKGAKKHRNHQYVPEFTALQARYSAGTDGASGSLAMARSLVT